jgi:hypothetical protein
MAGKPRTTDAQFEATRDVYKLAEKTADDKYQQIISELKEKHNYEILKATFSTKIDSQKMHEDFSRLLRVMFLRQVKEELKEIGAWTRYCEETGTDIKNADYEISKLGDFKDELLLNFARFCKYEINKIRYLTSGNSEKLGVTVENGRVLCGGKEVPLDPDEIQFILDKQEEKARQLQDELAAQKKASDRIQSDLHKRINKLEKDDARRKGVLADRDLSADEATFMKEMEALRLAFDGLLINADPGNIEALALDRDPSPRIRAAMVSTAYYMRMQILKYYDVVEQTYGDAIMNPEQPPFAAPGFMLKKDPTEGKPN